MAEKKETAKSAKQDQTFRLDEMRQHSQELFGVRPEVFDGAVFGVTAEKMKKDDVKKHIDEFLKREVK